MSPAKSDHELKKEEMDNDAEEALALQEVLLSPTGKTAGGPET